MNTNSYLFKTLLALDYFVAALLWRDDGVTISSYCGLDLRKSTPRIWAIVLGRWFLEVVNPGHCEKAILHDIQRAEEALVILRA